MTPEELNNPESRARRFLARVNAWAEKHAVDLRQPCPVCSGIQWVFDETPGKVGALTVHPRWCSSCGYTMFVKAELLG
jgi:hypothetical protein